MEERVRLDMQSLSPDVRFVRVLSDSGVFYDLVQKWRAREHAFRLRKTYYDAQIVIRAHVPPCICRDFTRSTGTECFREAVWKDGEVLYLPLEPKDRLQIYDIKHPAP